MRCPSAACGIAYPIVEGRPILVNEKNSIFSFSDYTARRATTMDLELDSKRRRPLWYRIKGLISKLMPNPSLCSTDFPLEEVLEHIAEGFVGDAKLLVIGAGEQAVDFSRGGKVLYTDVAIGNLTNMVCDAHDLPFVDACFDAVIANAVLEHVADPYRCVDEIHRVLRPAGFVYATTPFMQQVHMAQFDFTRFTHLGHRRLFRRFSEERSGVANGPAMVLAWSFERFVAAFAKSKWLYARLRTLARLIIFPIKYFDLVLSRRASAYDAASAYYFMGRKSDTVLSDRELIRLYRGLG
jgi:SAM-dependent methyltransferase